MADYQLQGTPYGIGTPDTAVEGGRIIRVRNSYNLRSVSETNRFGLQFDRSALCPIPQNSRSTARVTFDCLKNDLVTSQVVVIAQKSRGHSQTTGGTGVEDLVSNLVRTLTHI